MYSFSFILIILTSNVNLCSTKPMNKPFHFHLEDLILSLFPLNMLRNTILLYLAALALVASENPVHLIDPSCPDTCGNVSIPYPFGTKQGCYLNQDFLVHCNGTPTIGNSTYMHHVVNISINGDLSISTPVIKDCYYYPNSTFSNYTIISPNFPFSTTRNRFISIGCDSIAFISNGSYGGGCISYCDNPNSVDEEYCSGAGCCQTSNLPKGLFGYMLMVLSAMKYVPNNTDSIPCDYAFLADENHYKFKKADLFDFGRTSSVVPTVLEWSIGNLSCADAQSSMDYACTMEHTVCVDSESGPGYRCQCSPGFVGNPYLLNGCQDICKQQTCKSEIIKFTVIGATLFGVIVVLSCYFLWRHIRKRRLMKRRKSYFHQNGGPILQENLSLLEDAHTAFKIFTTEEMELATKSFDEGQIVGSGGFGVVYKGYLSDGRAVAIKKSKSVEQYEIDQFINEVVLLSKIQHQNVVGFYGCCLETPVPLLVYEFITNGTLLDNLYSEGTKALLSWKTRVKIASETAGVLAYLHHDHRPTIIHSDIKPHNILLDENFNAKVADFGISKLAPQNEDELCTKVKGTLGYLDPEFILSSKLTEKSDVYSFGVVLLELLTGQRVFSFDRLDEDRNLVKYFQSLVNDEQLVQVFDKMIANEENVEQLKRVSRIAGKCVSIRGDDRPNMKEVAMELGSLWMEVKQWWTPHDSLIERRSNNQCDEATTSFRYSHSGDHILMVSMLDPR